jgi:hypothetical protein
MQSKSGFTPSLGGGAPTSFLQLRVKRRKTPFSARYDLSIRESGLKMAFVDFGVECAKKSDSYRRKSGFSIAWKLR